MNIARFAIALLVLTGTASFVGCHSPAPVRPVEIEPLPPAPLPRIFDYEQKSLKDIDERTRRELLQKHYGDDMSARPAPPRPIETQPYFPPEVDPRPVREVVREYRYYDHGPHYYPYEGRRRYYRHHRQHRGLGNTLFFGTLGGIIGHHNDRTEEGILIGAGVGLLKDLLVW